MICAPTMQFGSDSEKRDYETTRQTDLIKLRTSSDWALEVKPTMSIWSTMSEVLWQWQSLQRATYRPTLWRRLLQAIICGQVAPVITGEWKLPAHLARLSATGTVHITRCKGGLIMVLFTVMQGRFLSSDLYSGYLLCSRELVDADIQFIETYRGLCPAVPYAASSSHASSDEPTVCDWIYLDKDEPPFYNRIYLDKQVAPDIYYVERVYDRAAM